MKAIALAAAFLVVTVAFAGCSGSSDPTEEPAPTARPDLAEGKGAIEGLLIDDIYRPIPGGLVLLQGAGLTATTDAAGQFLFLDVTPGTYVFIVSADRHEAAPANVDVVAGEYTEAEVSARRVFSEAGKTITTQYSVFIPCATSAVRTTVVYGGVLCPADLASDDYRPGLTGLDFSAETNLTYLIVELKANQVDNYLFVLRHDNGDPAGGDRWGSGQINNSDYVRVILKAGEIYQTWQESNKPWMNEKSKEMEAILFYLGQGGDQIAPTGCNTPAAACFGAGQRFAIKANIILTAFIGEPDPGIVIEDYHILGPSKP